MSLLIAAIVFALLISIVLPIAAGIWSKRKFGITWRIVLFGSLGYMIVQAILVFIFNGFTALVENGRIVLSDQGMLVVQIILSVFLSALLGVLIRWIGIKFLNEKLDNLEGAIGIGVGYGGVESILMVGLPLLSTFVTMLSNMNVDHATSNLDPIIIGQIEQLWQVSPLIPLAGSLERIAAFVLHITVTILIVQSFTKKNFIWVAGAFGLELLENGIIVALAEIGLKQGWLVLISISFMAINLYLLYKLGVKKIFDKSLIDLTTMKQEVSQEGEN